MTFRAPFLPLNGYLAVDARVWRHTGARRSVKVTKAPEGATTGAVAGGAIGGIVGLLEGMCAGYPGPRDRLSLQPIMAALSGAAAGLPTGGVVGALVGLGIPGI